ncbi:MAG: hypothetical protein UT63_C0029G0007 [Candidatus Gottesmanbacteria bacterium GW2011_GWC2_39_8]|uniref:Aspartate kinase n=1 Tax=Candidatus Gottesmanbacteria bacterium GW2011_GWC2_39_8 TaxID=1618450 RepID=A0A0G0T4V0_9BACT|nr:MAG: hypothetical protein UT63_C0029G0007 [Candidatus Gottesmanbacteria bacterium GW2011_GWC2_39_8]
MSNKASFLLRKYPLITRYARNGLVNFVALAKLIKENSKKTGESVSVAALSMDLRRYIAKQPQVSVSPFDFSKYSLQLVTRTNIHEIILNKNQENRKRCLEIVYQISKTKHFVTMVEGEKEIVVMTDHPLKDLLKKKIKNLINNYTDNLGFISVNFPIELRGVPGVYGLITSTLSDMGISIHSFHTIGGEILILVKNVDLVTTQEVLQSLLFDKS